MNLSFTATPLTDQPQAFHFLQVSLPNNFSPQEINKTVDFVNTAIHHTYNLLLIPIQKIPADTHQTIKKIDLRHFYHFLSTVEIRAGVYDTEFDVDLGGLQGQLLLFFQDDQSELYYIQWTNASFLQIPPSYLIRLLENQLPWSGTFIEYENILPATTSQPLESLDAALLRHYLRTLSEQDLRFWKENILPRLNTNSSVFSAWEQIFSGYTQPLSITYQPTDCNQNKTNTALILTPAGHDRIHGVWVSLSTKAESIIVPLSTISRIEDPDLNQRLSYYHAWAALICPQ